MVSLAVERDMEEIAISKFKATCLAVLERVRRTRRPVRVTRFGQPVDDVRPPSLAPRAIRKLGVLAGSVKIHGDIIAPAGDPEDWEAGRS